MSQVNARQKLRRLIRMAFAATPSSSWMASALLFGVSANALFAQVPGNAIPAAPQSTSAPAGSTGVSQPVPPEAVLRWLNNAEVSAKTDMTAACVNFAEALRGRKTLTAPNEAVEKRLKEVEAFLLAGGVKQQNIVDAIRNLRPLDQSLRALQGQAVAAAPQMPNMLPAGAPQVTQTMPAGYNAPQGVVPAAGTAGQVGNVQPGVFNPGQDMSRMQQAAARTVQQAPAVNASGEELYQQGIQALSQGNREQALELFRRAWQFNGELDPAIRTQLKDKLASLQANDIRLGGPESVPADPATQESLINRSRLMSEVTGEINAAEANRDIDPNLVAERLQQLRTKVSQADIDSGSKKQMLSMVDRAITSHQIYMSQNRATIDQNMRNRQVEEEISLEREEKYKVDQQIASLVETYNDLMEESRYSEAEVVAKQVGQLDPNSEIATLMYTNARLASRAAESDAIRNKRQDNFTDLMNDVDRAAFGTTDKEPYVLPDAKSWRDLTERRARLKESERSGMSPAEQAIRDKLNQPVLVDFKARPLSEVVKVLSDMTGILIHLDTSGLATEGLSPETPITLSLGSQVKLKSALNLMLKEHNLTYDPRDEVLLITSSRNTAQGNKTKTYSVSDLVIPIPNFQTDYNSGMAGAIRAAYESIGNGLAARVDNRMPYGPAGMQMANVSLDPKSNALGQIMPGMGAGVAGGMPGVLPWAGSNNGPMMGNQSPFMQGGAVPGPAGPSPANYDELISLIQQTVDPDSWQSNGGASTITQFPGNLSLVVSAPQTTHEKLSDLLESLRRLQDLQVTIEVRFITLNDNFFERIGVDFDFKIDDNYKGGPISDDQGKSVTIGLSNGFTNAIAPTADLDLTFRQDSFTSAAPNLGGFDGSAGQFGFAILSDLEMFFFLTAAQGDSRTSVLQAPRVTMFDGQSATINDTVSRPFVTSLTPVVGDFAVGVQPIIVVINEGTVLNVQALVSQDKRFVRLTLNPTFSRIDRVETFTFQGETTSKSGTAVIDPDTGLPAKDQPNNNVEKVTVGTTVQQPVVASTSVQTTVSVPDGGTILLGGIKRMRESRIERGIPILSKIPYVNRLFKNTGVGRETSTLMLTVTPRIIIQEEEEANILGTNAP
ncbi:MAG: hypothetical protein U0892_04090 [Pirellulales bacterium]